MREGPGRVSGQALVFHFPSVSIRKPHPELQTDIQKSALSRRRGVRCRGQMAGRPGACAQIRNAGSAVRSTAASLRQQLLALLPPLSRAGKTCRRRLSQEEERLVGPHPGLQLAGRIPPACFFFSSATRGRSLKFWKLSGSGLSLAACKRKYEIAMASIG